MSTKTCLNCMSGGQIVCDRCDGSGQLKVNWEYETCEKCQGTARVTCLVCQGTGEVPLTSEDIEQQEERSANAHSRMEELRAKYGDEAIEKARKEIKQGDQKRGVFHLLASFGGGVAGAFLGADAAPLFWFPVGAFGFFCGFVSVFWVVGFFVKYDD